MKVEILPEGKECLYKVEFSILEDFLLYKTEKTNKLYKLDINLLERLELGIDSYEENSPFIYYCNLNTENVTEDEYREVHNLLNTLTTKEEDIYGYVLTVLFNMNNMKTKKMFYDIEKKVFTESPRIYPSLVQLSDVYKNFLNTEGYYSGLTDDIVQSSLKIETANLQLGVCDDF